MTDNSKKDGIKYDVTALQIFMRLEAWLEKFVKKEFPKKYKEETKKRGKTAYQTGNKSKSLTFAGKISFFPRGSKIQKTMVDISDDRNTIAHADRRKKDIHHSMEIVETLDIEEFRKFKDKCVNLSNLLLGEYSEYLKLNPTGMEEIMIPTLKYDMGNAGDIIKHGAVAEFVEWWFVNQRESRLVFADTFGGCPWEDYKKVKGRVEALDDTALYRAYQTNRGKRQGEKYEKYFCAGHLVKEMTAQRFGTQRVDETVEVLVNDNNEDARNNFKYSGGMKLIEDLPNNDGYEVLNQKIINQYKPNLVLIDPYSDFLTKHRGKLDKIGELIRSGKNPDLFVMVFVLDMWSEGMPKEGGIWGIHERYTRERERLEKFACSVRCPKIDPNKTDIRGESGFASEILLISQQLENMKTTDLRERLEKLAVKATDALPLNKPTEKVMYWDGKTDR